MLKNALAQFSVFNPNAQRLLKANMIFGFLVPFYIIFSNTFIFNNVDGDISFNLIYSALHFLGNPLGFIFNGFLSRKLHLKTLFIFGMALIIINMAVMMFLPSSLFTELAVFIFGIVSGIGSGMYWSARTYLTIVSTTDDNRNFFSGLDFMFLIGGGIVTPLIIGNYIGLTVEYDILTKTQAYQSAIIFAVILVFIASLLVYKGKFDTVQIKRFLYYKFDKEWTKTRWFVFIMGLFHGVYLSLPAIFIMKFVGNESTLGFVDSITHAAALITIYITSRFSKPEHRSKIMLAGTLIFLVGTSIFGGFLGVNASLATVALVAAFYLTDPMINFPYRAQFMKAVDKLRGIEGRSEFTYIVDIEQFNALGRIVAVVIFFVMYQFLDVIIAAPIIVTSVCLIQFINVRLAKKIGES